MKKLYSLWDVYKYPLVLLFIAAGLKGFGNLCLDPLVTGLIPGEYGWLNNIWSSFIYIGTFLERMFPYSSWCGTYPAGSKTVSRS